MFNVRSTYFLQRSNVFEHVKILRSITSNASCDALLDLGDEWPFVSTPTSRQNDPSDADFDFCQRKNSIK